MRATQSGFTLLEVLVAVAILGLGLTMILSSQVGLFSSASRAQHLTIASNLLRCKMSEVELELVQEGYPLIDQSDEGPCCADESEQGYRCTTKIERVELPEPGEMPESDAGTESGEDLTGMFGALSKLQEQPPAPGDPNALQEIAKTVGASAVGSGLAPMVLGMVYPQLKLMLEASIRRVTVTVLWKEGLRERTLSATQFVADPQQGGLEGDADGGLGSAASLIPGLGGPP